MPPFKMIEKDEVVTEILEKLDLFSGLKRESLLKLASLFKERIFNENEFIFEEGSMGNSMMIIVSGEVRVSQTDESVEEELVVLKKGDLFGEMAMLEELPRTATIIANTNVIILEIKKDDFFQFLNDNSRDGVDILFRLAKTLSSRLREADSKLKVFVSLSKWL